MKNLKMYISFLLFLLFTSSQVKATSAPKAKDIPVYKVKKHLGTRTTEPSVTASLEQNQLTVNVSRYVGIARVKIYDDSGSFVANARCSRCVWDHVAKSYWNMMASGLKVFVH